jgi:hypothetical protein
MEHLTLNDHRAMSGAGTRAARFGERSEYEGSRAPASAIALHEETTA